VSYQNKIKDELFYNIIRDAPQQQQQQLALQEIDI